MKTVIEMAREAAGDDWKLFQDFLPEIHRLAEIVRADAIAEEREACAKVCDVLGDDYGKAGLPMTYQALAATSKEIRARGNT